MDNAPHPRESGMIANIISLAVDRGEGLVQSEWFTANLPVPPLRRFFREQATGKCEVAKSGNHKKFLNPRWPIGT